jgi:hypothetical protein
VTTICWTILHRSGAPVHHAAAYLARAARIVHHAARASRHLAATAPRHSWIEVVCKAVPAALAGGGLLLPHPANPPRLPEPVPFVQPAPAFSPWSDPGWMLPPEASPPGSAVGPAILRAPPGEAVPEPPSVGLLLGGVAGLVAIRLTSRRLAYSSGGIHPTLSLMNLGGGGPIS